MDNFTPEALELLTQYDAEVAAKIAQDEKN